MNELAPTLPMNQAQMPVLASGAASLTILHPRLQDTDRYVMNVGGVYGKISARATLLVKTYVRTLNIRACCESYEKQYKVGISQAVVQRWLRKPWIASVVTDRLCDKAIANGLTEDKWKAIGVLAMAGDAEQVVKMIQSFVYKQGTEPGVPEGGYRITRMTAFFWERMGENFGYSKGSGTNINIQNQQINLIQENGKP